MSTLGPDKKQPQDQGPHAAKQPSKTEAATAADTALLLQSKQADATQVSDAAQDVSEIIAAFSDCPIPPHRPLCLQPRLPFWDGNKTFEMDTQVLPEYWEFAAQRRACDDSRLLLAPTSDEHTVLLWGWDSTHEIVVGHPWRLFRPDLPPSLTNPLVPDWAWPYPIDSKTPAHVLDRGESEVTETTDFEIIRRCLLDGGCPVVPLVEDLQCCGPDGFALTLLWEVLPPNPAMWSSACPMGYLRAVPRLSCDIARTDHVEAYRHVRTSLLAQRECLRLEQAPQHMHEKPENAEHSELQDTVAADATKLGKEGGDVTALVEDNAQDAVFDEPTEVTMKMPDGMQHPHRCHLHADAVDVQTADGDDKDAVETIDDELIFNLDLETGEDGEDHLATEPEESQQVQVQNTASKPVDLPNYVVYYIPPKQHRKDAAVPKDDAEETVADEAEEEKQQQQDDDKAADEQQRDESSYVYYYIRAPKENQVTTASPEEDAEVAVEGETNQVAQQDLQEPVDQETDEQNDSPAIAQAHDAGVMQDAVLRATGEEAPANDDNAAATGAQSWHLRIAATVMAGIAAACRFVARPIAKGGRKIGHFLRCLFRRPG